MIDLKRNSEVLSKAREVVANSNIDVDGKQKMKRVFEIAENLCSDNYGEYSDGEQIGKIIADFVNDCNYDEEGFINRLTKRTHRTLQSYFFSTILRYIKECATMDDMYFDGRNDEIKILCKQIVENNADIFEYVQKVSKDNLDN